MFWLDSKMEDNMEILIVFILIYSLIAIGLGGSHIFKNRDMKTPEDKIIFLLNLILLGIGLIGFASSIGIFIP